MNGEGGSVDDRSVPKVIEGLRMLLKAIDAGTMSCSRHTATGSRVLCWHWSIGRERKKRNHIRQLEALDYKVTLEPAA